jgi:hypothetical protein
MWEHGLGVVERSHRVDTQEFYQPLDKDGIADDIHLLDLPEEMASRPVIDLLIRPRHPGHAPTRFPLVQRHRNDAGEDNRLGRLDI